MILDKLENAAIYREMEPNLVSAFGFLVGNDLSSLPVGRHEIDGEDVYAMVAEYDTKPKQGAKWEAHRRYIDIQCVVQGAEQIGWAIVDDLDVTQDYDAGKDCVLLEGEGQFFTLRPGLFALLHPHDAHMPGLAIQEPVKAKKVVVKVAV